MLSACPALSAPKIDAIKSSQAVPSSPQACLIGSKYCEKPPKISVIIFHATASFSWITAANAAMSDPSPLIAPPVPLIFAIKAVSLSVILVAHSSRPLLATASCKPSKADLSFLIEPFKPFI